MIVEMKVKGCYSSSAASTFHGDRYMAALGGEATVDVLLRLVGDLKVLAAAWEHEPFVSQGLDDFSDVFSVDRAERLLYSGLPLDSVRLFQRGEQLSADLVARQRERGGRGREAVADGAKAVRQLACGATLVLEELQTYSPQIAAFGAAVSEATGYGTYCAAFLTPPGSRGVAAHYDTASVFLRQVMGSKRWRVSAPTQRWPVREFSRRRHTETDLVLDIVLKEGDCLYLPRGYIHVGDATDDASAHLSIALRPVTWGSVLQRLTATACTESERFREALPPRFAAVDREALLREQLASLAAHLSTLALAPELCLPSLDPAVAAPYRPGSLSEALHRRGEPSHADG
jgi:lysine-specific demethylase/histidyl-hydroxylase NO66